MKQSWTMPLLVALAVVLAVLVYLDNTGRSSDIVRPVERSGPAAAAPGPAAGRPQPAAAAAGGALLHPFADVTEQSLPAIVEHPLFEPSRRPVEVVTAPSQTAARAEPAGNETPQFRIIGIVASPGRSVAIIAGSDGVVRRIETGDMLGGWEVAAIAPLSVTVARDGQRIEVVLARRGAESAPRGAAGRAVR